MKTWIVGSLVVATLTVGSVWAAVGNELGNGLDNYHADHGAAWFLGKDKAIKVCLASSAGFDQPVPALKESIDKAFGIWREYAEKRVASVHDPKVSFATRVEWVACDGREDLKFLFDVKTPEVDEELKRFDNPTAFAKRTRYSAESGWGKGFIWFAASGAVAEDFPNWKLRKQLELVILHELGHVMGCDHSPFTVMDANLRMFLDPKNLAETPLAIDLMRELVANAPLNFAGEFGDSAFPGGAEAMFEWLVGRKPCGEIRATIMSEVDLKGLRLRLRDEVGEAVVPLNVNEDGVVARTAVFFPTGNAFKVSTPVAKLIDTARSVQGVFYGSARDAAHAPVPVVVEYNGLGLYLYFIMVSDGPATLKVFKDGQIYYLLKKTHRADS